MNQLISIDAVEKLTEGPDLSSADTAYSYTLHSIEGIETAIQTDCPRKRNLRRGISRETVAQEFLKVRREEFRRGQHFFFHAGARTLAAYISLLKAAIAANPNEARYREGWIVKKVIALYSRKRRSASRTASRKRNRPN